MLIGEYPCSLDVKGRLSFPAKLRDELGQCFIIAKGLGKPCLFVYSLENWKALDEKMRALPISKAGALKSLFFASASEAEPDKQGRIVIPAGLRGFGNLEKDAVVIGVSDHCEIWSREAWEQLCATTDSEALALALAELGI